MVNHEWQEIKVVSDACANADPGRRMPPMLDVTLFELSCRRSQDLRSSFCRDAVHQCHYILELVPKAISSAGLIKCGAGPNAANQNLIKKPAVYHQVHSRIGRGDLQCGQVAVPLQSQLPQRRINWMG